MRALRAGAPSVIISGSSTEDRYWRAAMADPHERSQRVRTSSRWHWLLVVPVVVPLLVFLFNSTNPRIFGFPRFYWLQLAFILLGVGTTTLVYQLTKRTER
jgi:uncharacterized membrane protein